VEHLKKQEYDYDRKLDLRRKQFSVVLQSLSTMKNVIESDLKFDDYLLEEANNENIVEAFDSNSNQPTVIINNQAMNGCEVLEDEKVAVAVALSNNSASNGILDEMGDEEDSVSSVKRSKNDTPTNEVEMEEY
jgi:hypothetical protein